MNNTTENQISQREFVLRCIGIGLLLASLLACVCNPTRTVHLPKSTMTQEQAKQLILDHLETSKMAACFEWIRESRKTIEKEDMRTDMAGNFYWGPWTVMPPRGRAVLRNSVGQFSARIEQQGEEFQLVGESVTLINPRPNSK